MKYFAPNYVDPTGWAPCLCPCDPKTQPDAAPEINKLIQGVIDGAAKKPGASVADVRAAIEGSLIGPLGSMATGIERELSKLIGAGTIKGPASCPANSAPAIVVCGRCIGTDKLGHFIEEGLLYYDVSSDPSLGDAYAKALGPWTEGLPNPGLDPKIDAWLRSGRVNFNFAAFGRQLVDLTMLMSVFGDDAGIFGGVLDPNGSASPADIAANESGMQFWKDLMGSGVGSYNFDVCKYLNDNWDHTKKPNVPGVRRGKDPQKDPVFVPPKPGSLP